MSPVEKTVEWYGRAWQEPDPAERRRLLDACWADDGVYCDPTARVRGRAGLAEHIGGFQEQFAGCRIELTTAPDEHDGYVRFGWRIVRDGGDQVSEGTDFGELDDDGRLRRIVGFFGPLRPA